MITDPQMPFQTSKHHLLNLGRNLIRIWGHFSLPYHDNPLSAISNISKEIRRRIQGTGPHASIRILPPYRVVINSIAAIERHPSRLDAHCFPTKLRPFLVSPYLGVATCVSHSVTMSHKILILKYGTRYSYKSRIKK